jgi:glycosyltransferase involved in cell wall biosynthesis
MVLDAPWDRRLGGPRVHIELAEQLVAMGHEVEHFAWEDAFPKPAALPRVADFSRSFARRAHAWVGRHGNRYDVIDARAGSFFAPRSRLGFRGLQVTRSTGLLPIYEREFLAWDRRTPGGGARPLTRAPRRVQRAFVARRNQLGLERCDLINVLNSDEETYLRDELGMGDKTVKLLHGLTRERFGAFVSNRRPPQQRLENPVVAFIGAWGRRKGARDMAEIIAAVRASNPPVRFRLLGTGAPPSEVLGDCGGDPSGIEVVPSFESEELPALLGDVAVGILPSYVEGFPFSVIELLAAGAPVVAYDAPGARETLPRLDRSLLVKRGDGAALGRCVAELLARPERLMPLSQGAIDLADSLRWEDIAAETVVAYRERLELIRRKSD